MLAVMGVLLVIKPLFILFMLLGVSTSYTVYYFIKHPTWGQLLVRVLAECLGLILMLSLFVSLLLIYGQLMGV